MTYTIQGSHHEPGLGIRQGHHRSLPRSDLIRIVLLSLVRFEVPLQVLLLQLGEAQQRFQ